MGNIKSYRANHAELFYIIVWHLTGNSFYLMPGKEKMKSKLIYIWKIFIVAIINVMIIVMVYYGTSVYALSKIGSQGQEVTDIQNALTSQGYFSSKVDGIFGEQTKKAVIAFQKDNGLTADGVVGSKTLAALGIGGSGGGGEDNSGHGGYSKSDIDLLARIISAEARGEPYEGQVAVGAVIMNRIEHPSFPNTLSGVIYQPGAFSCLTDGGVNAPVADSAYKAAREAVNGSDPSGGAVYYYNPVKSTNKWIFSRPVLTVIGAHRFCS